MQYVPSLLSPGTAPETGSEVKALAGIRRAKPVQARTFAAAGGATARAA